MDKPNLIDKEAYRKLLERLENTGHSSTLVAISKKQDIEKISELYHLSQKHFGENYVQEVCQKREKLPSDIHWHFVGHLQRNKVKYIAPFITWIHSIDSLSLLDEIEKRAAQHQRHIQVLLQIHVAQEETKAGFSLEEFKSFLNILPHQHYSHLTIRGLMTMASFTEDNKLIRSEFKLVRQLFLECQQIQTPFCKWDTLSMGMSHDYGIALEEKSNMIRVGSLLFGKRI